jgi:serine/threonine protein phosphatase PrpC
VATARQGQVLLACVADGGGTARLSHFGSNIATTMTISLLSLLARSGLVDRLTKDEFRTFWRALVHDIRACIAAEAAQIGAGTEHFGTTLIAAAATRSRLAMMQIGDGFIVYAPAEHMAPQPKMASDTAGSPNPFRLGFEPKRGEYVGEVTWLTSSRWEDDFREAIIDEHIDFVCLSTDGLEKVAIVQADQAPHPGYFEFMRSQIKTGWTGEDLNRLVTDVVTNRELDKRTDDDKSLILARWLPAKTQPLL